jgi:hypothetical protein
MPKRNFNERGFEGYLEMKDTRDNTIRVQESSAANGPRCWIFVKDVQGREAYDHMGSLQAVSPHLSPAQAKRLAQALMRFVNTSKKRWGK